MKRLDYLNLEIFDYSKFTFANKDFKHTCYFPNIACNHQLHSSNPVLNSLVDLILKLSESLADYHQRKSISLDTYSEKFQEKNLILKTLCEQVSYLKQSQEELYRIVKPFSIIELPNRTELIKVSLQTRDLLVRIKDLLEYQKTQSEQSASKIHSLLKEIKELHYM